MATLQKDKLLEYLKHAISLETAIVTQNQIIDAYNKSAAKRKPVYVEETPSIREIPEPDERDAFGIFLDSVLVCGSLVGIIIGRVVYDVDGSAVFTLFLLALVFSVMGGLNLSNYLLTVKSGKRITKENEQERRRVKKVNKNNQKKYDNDYPMWIESNKESLAYLNAPLQKTKSTLEKLYSADVIYPKYRNLPALTSIYEYLITGRCDELTGSHGAYNMYEDEVRKDTVISQLNTVIANLEKIRQNQYMLYQQVSYIQQTTARIAYDLNQIKGYTFCLTELAALNTYYNGINAVNSSSIAYWGL